MPIEVHGCAAPTYDIRNKHIGWALPYGTSHNGARMGSGVDSALAEAATCCIFATPPLPQIFGSLEEAIRLYLNAACGWDLSLDDVKDIAQRNYYFNRAVSLREGYHPAKDDYLPPRAFDEPITDKYGTTWVWDREEYDLAKRNYYVDRLGLTREGLPPREGLKRLGLDFIIPVLEPMKAIG